VLLIEACAKKNKVEEVAKKWRKAGQTCDVAILHIFWYFRTNREALSNQKK
jgi:hypothetical protein